MFLNFVTALSENRFRRLRRACGRELNESFKLIREPIHWFATGLIKPLNGIDLKEWIIRKWALLIAQRKVDGAFGIHGIFNLYCIRYSNERSVAHSNEVKVPFFH